MAIDPKEEDKEMKRLKKVPEEVEAEAVAENDPIAQEEAKDTATPDDEPQSTCRLKKTEN
jgi:hypothetical protein